MKKIVSIVLLLLIFTTGTQAKIKFGVRGGYNIAKMYFDDKLLSSENNHGYYLGPTLKVDLPLGFDLDASALFNQTSVVTNFYIMKEYGVYNEEDVLILRRKTFAFPINLRKGFGFGDNLNVFAFAGPQFDFSLNKDISDVNWKWADSMISINIGVGATFFQHLEVRVNYNIPCGKTGEFQWKDSSTYDEAYQSYKANTGVWQIGAAIFF